MRWIMHLLTSAGFEIFQRVVPILTHTNSFLLMQKYRIALAYVYPPIFIDNNFKKGGAVENLPLTQSLYVKSVINNL